MEKQKCPSCGRMTCEIGPNSGVCRTCHQAMCNKVSPAQWRMMQVYVNHCVADGFSYNSALRRIKAIVNGEAFPPALKRQPLVIPESEQLTELDSASDIDRKLGFDQDMKLMALDRLGLFPGEAMRFDAISEYTGETE